MKGITLHEEMGAAIVERLRDFTELPARGFVAGQAVSSAVSELFGDGKAVVYNDIDVFREQTREEKELAEARAKLEGPRRQKKALGTCQFTTLEVQEEYQNFVERASSRYQVIRTARKDMLNEVIIWLHSGRMDKFLQTFDINAVQAGVDLEKKRLVWTPQFEEFTKTRQLDVVTLHTPFQSLIRYFRKREELEGTYGNDERIIEMMAAAYELEFLDQKRNNRLGEGLHEYHNMRWRFGEAYRKKFETVASKIMPHFEIQTEVRNDYPVSVLVPRFQAGKDLVQDRGTMNLVHCLPFLSRALREKHAKGTQGRLRYLANCRTEGPTLTHTNWVTRGESYVKGNVTPAQMAQMDKVVKEHAISAHLWADTLGEQWERFSLIRSEVSHRGMWVYGVLENKPGNTWTAETLKAMLDVEAKLLKQELKKPSLPPLSIAGCRIRELTTGMDLVGEGAELHHCVGGYAGNVKSGYSRLLSLRPAGDCQTWLTAELAKDGLAWRVVQLRGLVNRSHTAEEMAVAETYVHYTNLAMLAGPAVTCAMVKMLPKMASLLGENITKALVGRTLRPRYRLPVWLQNASGALAVRLGFKEGALISKGGWRISAQYNAKGFWMEYFKAKTAELLYGKEPQFARVQYIDRSAVKDDSDDIPF